MTNYSSDTEGKILEAAKKVFIEKGLEGTRMQEIANEAKINKALLHYYYRTKEKLFNAVFQFAITRFIPHIEGIFNSDKNFFEILEAIIEQYITLISKNPFIPIFVLHEINRHPDRLADIIKSAGIQPKILIEKIEKEVEKGTIRPVSALNLIVNIISLCVFPFAARPLIQRLLFDNDKHAYTTFIQSRKTEVTSFIINAIKI
ncbi:MAG: TetR/AcrR family transcriptional regulator [Bacteroidales bacterium]|nr:TetR/AcrR family transcriptional regulator [Bacteroidales bacterium]